MKYLEIKFILEPMLPAAEVLVAELAERGFESFVESDDGLLAYIPQADFSESLLDDLLTAQIEAQAIQWSIAEMPDQNWNAEWEKNFEPIVVDDRALIRAPFHTGLPHYELEIIIEPKMSFGTGHHATTHLMLSQLMKMDVTGQAVLDMGSGTGVLAIAAEKLGAKSVDAIDIDEWAFENGNENAQRNACSRITCIKGGSESIPRTRSYDIILANINRNILLRDMHHYVKAMAVNSHIVFSGFYKNDVDELERTAVSSGLRRLHEAFRGEWYLLCYTN